MVSLSRLTLNRSHESINSSICHQCLKHNFTMRLVLCNGNITEKINLVIEMEERRNTSQGQLGTESRSDVQTFLHSDGVGYFQK